MNISLRKASAIQNAIQETIRSIEINPLIQVSEFVDHPEQTINAAKHQLVENDGRRVDLAVAYYNIRSLVGAANVSCGINMKLATAAFVDKRIAQLGEMIAVGERDIGLVERRIEKIRATDNNSRLYGREDSVTTSVLTSEQVTAFKSELQALKKEKQRLNDEILELNIKTEVPLGDNIVTTLTREGLI